MDSSARFSGAGTIELRGRFTYESHKMFRAAYDECLASPANTIAVDFHAVDYLDSAALGMLLVAREKATSKGKTVVLKNCRGNVKSVLDVACFHKLFAIQ